MQQPDPSRDSRQHALSRRKLVARASVAGAAAAAAAALPAVTQGAKAAPSVGAKPDTGSGYQLTEHVKRYYRTAKV
ncbi:formate dehydrogenase [Variovorax dokdonensis]|uniref:Formate dehydrogenase n=1 Tax=Variovorax dokdonensis TaxID=344883 RepID=A0ABT7NA67_9BURK|nr:formate dehydrogenase [Variovorax dokdonensis]MDM0044833.1 formate dehydrogenase [Variovorax dokdonensis]